MSPAKENYRISFADAEEAVGAAVQMSLNTQGRTTEDRGIEVGSTVFGKLVCHANSLLWLAPKAPLGHMSPAQELWDISSMAVLVRAAIESYYTMFYVALDDVSDDIREFRWILWDYHCELRRFQKLKLIRSTSERMIELGAEVDELRIKVTTHPIYENQTDRIKRRLRDGELGVFANNTELSSKAGIAPEYYKTTFKFLSSYVHTHPFCISQLKGFRGGTDESLRLIDVLLRYGIVYLCFALRDFARMVPDQSSILDGNVGDLVNVWTGVATDFGK